MPSSRQVGRVSSSTPRETSEYSICTSLIACTACARRMLSAPTPNNPDAWTGPACTQVSDRADGVLDRNVRVEPGQPVDVGVIGAEPSQGVGQGRLHRGQRPPTPKKAPSGSRWAPEIDTGHRPVPVPAAQGTTDK